MTLRTRPPCYITRTTTRTIAFAIEGENKLLGIHQLSNHLAYSQPCLGCIVDANSLGRPAQRLVIHCPLHCWSEPFSGNADVRAIRISRRPLMRQRAAPKGVSFNPAVIDADAAPSVLPSARAAPATDFSFQTCFPKFRASSVWLFGNILANLWRFLNLPSNPNPSEVGSRGKANRHRVSGTTRRVAVLIWPWGTLVLAKPLIVRLPCRGRPARCRRMFASRRLATTSSALSLRNAREDVRPCSAQSRELGSRLRLA
jgi:hypothetical protein